jgi:branched-chain amino acid transport system permease protein
MAIITQLFLNGLIAGGIYALVALGYTMVYGILKFINFAHGEIVMIGAYLGLVLHIILGLNIILSFLLAIILAAGIGYIIEKIAYKPLRQSNRLILLITAIAVSLLLQSIIMLIFGSQIRSLRPGKTATAYQIFGATITDIQIIIIVVSISLMILLHLFIKYTKTGKAMRAVADNFEVASVIGIDVDKVISIIFMIGSALAAAGGVLVALEQNMTPLMGVKIGITAFAAAVVGGIGNIYGAVLGGFLIGFAENFGIWFIPSGYKEAIAFVILLVTLLIKPTGIFGGNSEEEVRL